MQVYDLRDSNDQIFAFEINNSRINRKRVVEIINQIPNAVILKRPKALSWFREDVFCEFQFAGQHFQVMEPFGDNSRYLIGTKDNASCSEIDTLRSVFLQS